MPMVDMPLPELLKYQGKNPCPKDMDSFWDKSIAQMHQLNPQVELQPADFKAPSVECYHLYFRGMGGAKVHAKFARPKGAKKGSKLPAVVMFHGYSGSSGDWLDKVSWAASGFVIAALDVRGQAGRSEDAGTVAGNTLRGHIIRGLHEDSPEKLFFRNVFLDTAQLARIVMDQPEVDPSRVGALGGSQGGALTLACASLEPNIKRAAPTFPFLCDYRRVWEMDLAKAAYEELQTYFRTFDPRHERENEIFTKLGYIDCQHLARRIKAHVLMGVGLMDTVCPPSTQFAAYNKITSKKEYVLYPDFGHEGLPGFGDKVFEFMCGL